MNPCVSSWWERRLSIILSRILEKHERREIGLKSEREEGEGILGIGIMIAFFHWGGKKEVLRVLELITRISLVLYERKISFYVRDVCGPRRTQTSSSTSVRR